MPTSFFFKPAVDTQSLPLELQQSILMYLSVEDVALMANTSRALKQAVTTSEPPPEMEFHQDLQLFKERRAILAGYHTLQQSTLPSWLKARWSLKKNMMIAISQAVISLDVDPAIPLSRRVKPIDDALVLTEAWPKWIIEIHRNDQELVAEQASVLDALSLQGLRANYHVQLLCNSRDGFLHEDQALVLALLEISEIFLSCADTQLAIAGVQALYRDYMGGRRLIDLFTERDNVFQARNRLLSNGVSSDSPANDSSDDEEQTSSELDDKENRELLVRLNFYLTAPVLLAAIWALWTTVCGWVAT